MSFKTISAITRGTWAIQLEYAHSVLPLVANLLAGETVDFGFASEKPQANSEPLPIFCAAPGVFSVGVGQNIQSVPHESIAVVDIIGPVMKYGDACSYGSADYAGLIGHLAAAENITGIVLNIDSPGGQVAGTKLLADAIHQAAAKKPVVAMINDGIAASAAMWIASAADEIYTTKKSDQVGSIGVFTTLADMTEHYKQKGIHIREIYSRLSPDKNAIAHEALAGNDEPLKDQLDTIAQDFIDTIRANRGEKLTSDEWTTGKMFRAKQATKMGLIDGVLSFDQIISRVQKLSSKNSMSMQENKPVATVGNTPAFAHIMVAAGIDHITVCDDGFAMNEEAMNNLEQVLGTHVGEVEELQRQLRQHDALQMVVDQQTASITDLENRLAAAHDRIAELEALPPAGGFQQTAKDADELGNNPASKYRTSYDEEMERLQALKNS